MAASGVILFPGAGGNREHQLLIAFAEASSIPVARVDFAYRIKAGKKRTPPARMPKLLDDVHAAVEKYTKLWSVDASSLVIGGRSMGGRVCSIAAAEGLEVAGLTLLSYPLHPPGKPEKLRVDHFAELLRPVLLVQGRKDPFGTPAEFAEHLPSIPGPVTELWVDGNHDPKPSLTPHLVEQMNRWVSTL